MGAQDDKTAAGCLALIGVWVLSWPAGAIRAAVAMKGWEWFVTDTFGAPSLGLVEAWGLFLLISFTSMTATRYSSGRDRDPFAVMVEGFLLSLAMSAFLFVSLLILVSFR